ncbi:hypothetical protein [Streptococcus vestibularis]|uniref:hypothetical protein n=1 Tax=Streptococcus vestibularis TaxID=1343 RepID=UPI00241C2947|nr:hypothetical protein [Streptococcus vestibularis]MBS6505454.1 hypothetical protein [Streptococcus vestibularis]
MGLDQEVTYPEPTEEVDEYDVAEEVFEDVPLGDEEETTLLEIEELSPVSHADQGQTEENSEAASKEAQAIWMKAFKTYVGRQPLPEEFLLGKSSGMMCQPSISLSQMVRQRNQPSQPWLRERKS